MTPIGCGATLTAYRTQQCEHRWPFHRRHLFAVRTPDGVPLAVVRTTRRAFAKNAVRVPDVQTMRTGR